MVLFPGRSPRVSLAGAWILSACHGEIDKVHDTAPTCEMHVTAGTSDEQRLVVTLDWADVPAGFETWAEYGVDGTYTCRAPGEPLADGAWHATLYGLPPFTDVSWRVVARGQGDDCEVTGITPTGGRPESIGEMEATTHLPDARDAFVYLAGAVMNSGGATLAILDREARLLWYAPVPAGRASLTTLLSHDGLHLLANVFSMTVEDDQSEVFALDMAGRLGATVPTPWGHHSFRVLPDGTVAWLAVDIRSWTDPSTGETQDVVGDAVWTVAPEGSPTRLFSTWDWREPSAGSFWDLGFYPQGRDWTHGNAISWNEERGSFLVTLAGLDAVVEVDATTGAVVQAFGEDVGLPVEDWNDRLLQPHEATWLETGNLLVSTLDLEGWVQAAEYEVDQQAGVLRRVGRWGEQGVAALAQGQAVRLKNGNTLENSGTAGLVVEYTPEGDKVWELHAPLGYWFGTLTLLETMPGREDL